MTREPEILSGTDELIEDIKALLGIDKPNGAMTDLEIREVTRYIGDRAPDTVWIDGKPQHGRQGIEIMLFLALTEFPEFYQRHELSQEC